MMESDFTTTSVSSFRTLGCHAVQPHRLVHIQLGPLPLVLALGNNEKSLLAPSSLHPSFRYV